MFKTIDTQSACAHYIPVEQHNTEQLAQMKIRTKKAISAAIEKGLSIFAISGFILIWMFSAYEISRFIANN